MIVYSDYSDTVCDGRWLLGAKSPLREDDLFGRVTSPPVVLLNVKSLVEGWSEQTHDYHFGEDAQNAI